MAIYKLNGVVQHYAWGGQQFIPDLLGVENADGEPFAELWMGTHVKGVAELETPERKVLLSDFINKNPAQILGQKTAEQFDNKLPFLFKVLDVNKMLSIQSHPTKAAAEIGFAKEQKTGILVTAPNRTYRDDNHKPEIMVALTDFWLLHGFKSVEGIQAVLAIPEFTALRPYFEGDNIFRLYQTIMEMPQSIVDELLAPLWERLRPQWEQQQLHKSNPDYWAAQAFLDYTRNGHFDRGIFSIYLFNLVFVKAGQSIFQAAGIPHAYLGGVNIELMANSDNVFRGGLTPKHIDVPELLKHLMVEPITPKVENGIQVKKGKKKFPNPAVDFDLYEIRVTKEINLDTETNEAASIFIATEGAATFEVNQQQLILKKGESCFMMSGVDYTISSTLESVLFQATVPVE